MVVMDLPDASDAFVTRLKNRYIASRFSCVYPCPVGPTCRATFSSAPSPRYRSFSRRYASSAIYVNDSKWSLWISQAVRKFLTR